MPVEGMWCCDFSFRESSCCLHDQGGYSGIGIDGRPEDLGKGYSPEQMPVISDNYMNWLSWNGIFSVV